MTSATPAPLKKLNRREQRLADLVLTGLKGAQALRQMNAKSQIPRTPQQLADSAYRMLALPHVKAYMAERRKDLSDATGVTAEQIVREVSLVGFGNLKSLYNEKGELTAIDQLPEDVSAMLAGIEVEELFEGRGEEREHVGRLRKVRAWPKVEALEKLAKMLGFLKDKVEIDLNAPPPIINILPYEDADAAEREARASVSRNTPST